MSESKTTPSEVAQRLADKISSRLGIMKADGKEFVAWDDGGFAFAAENIQAALDKAYNNGVKAGFKSGVAKVELEHGF